MKLEFNGKTYELPKWTMKIARLQDEVEKESTNEMLYKKSYEFVKAIIPKTELDEVLDGKSIEDVDLVKLNNVYKSICDIYVSALQETTMDLTINRLDKMSGVVDTIERIASANEKLTVK